METNAEVAILENKHVTKDGGVSHVVLRQIEATALPLNHIFAKGLYLRELFIPKGVAIVGRYHRGNTVNTLLSGRVSVLMEGKVFEITAPHVFETAPGSKIIYAHEDSRWMTTHINVDNETDLDKLQETLMDDSKSFLKENQNQMSAFIATLGLE